MTGTFFYLGDFDTGSVGLALPLGDGSPSAVTQTTISLPTTASTTVDFFKNMIALVTAGSGAGQWRTITSYTTAWVATVRAWDAPYPNTASTIVYGIPMAYADILHIRTEYGTTTAATGALRGEVYADHATTPLRVLSASTTFQYIASTAGLQGASTTAQGESKVVSILPASTILGKVYCETAPTAGVMTVYAAGSVERRGSI